MNERFAHLELVQPSFGCCWQLSKEAPLNVLSIEKDLAENGVIRKTFNKRRGAETFSEIRPIVHPVELAYKNMPRPGIEPGTFRSSV